LFHGNPRRCGYAVERIGAGPPTPARHSPSLAGQKGPYLLAQLQAFAQGARRNDINAQVRAVAKALTPEEMQALATWYATQR
jgi:cytochrome c553